MIAFVPEAFPLIVLVAVFYPKTSSVSLVWAGRLQGTTWHIAESTKIDANRDATFFSHESL